MSTSIDLMTASAYVAAGGKICRLKDVVFHDLVVTKNSKFDKYCVVERIDGTLACPCGKFVHESSTRLSEHFRDHLVEMTSAQDVKEPESEEDLRSSPASGVRAAVDSDLIIVGPGLGADDGSEQAVEARKNAIRKAREDEEEEETEMGKCIRDGRNL